VRHGAGCRVPRSRGARCVPDQSSARSGCAVGCQPLRAHRCGRLLELAKEMSHRSRGLFTAVATLAASVAVGAQQQQPTPRTAWPCGGRLDPSYFRIAEGSGGQLFLLAPEEIGDSAPLLTASTSHPQTIFRLAGSVTPGLHDFRVPIDPSVESVAFSVSVQCLEAVYVLDPSGALVSGDDVTDFSNFRAERMVIVRHPKPGIWMVRMAGRGVAG